jgi:hypothetical protein
VAHTRTDPVVPRSARPANSKSAAGADAAFSGDFTPVSVSKELLVTTLLEMCKVGVTWQHVPSTDE